MIYSPYSIDYSAGVDIVDPLTNTIYTNDTATMQPPHIKSRLICRPRKVGCMVLTIDECEALLSIGRVERMTHKYKG